MALTTCVRKLLLGAALSVAGVVAMHGVAGAEEAPDAPAEPVQAPAARPSTADTAVADAPAGDIRAAAPTGEGSGQQSAPSEQSGRSQQEAGERPGPQPAADPVPAASDVRAAQPGGSIVSPGPLTEVHTSPDLNCAVDHGADPSPEFHLGTACGTFLAVNGVLFGPADVPAAHSAEPRTAYTPLRQSPVTGSGSFADPYRLVTEVAAGATGLSVVQVDAYVAGQESYRTDVTVINAGPAERTALLYRAGDCLLLVGNDEGGFGDADPTTGAVACVGGLDVGDGFVAPGSHLVEWLPISPGSHFYAAHYDSVWARIGFQLPFPDLCVECDEFLDNAAGLSWAITVPAGGSVTRSHLTTFSPEGLLPLTLSKTVDSPGVAPGSVVTYRIIVENPNPLSVDLHSVVDTLADGFAYVPGSTSGPTRSDPTVVGGTLTWAGPLEVPPFGALALEFSVIVPSAPGTYVSVPSVDAGRFAVAPRGDMAPVTVIPTIVLPTPELVRDLTPSSSSLAPLSSVRVAGASSRAPARPVVAEAERAGSASAGELPLTGYDPAGLLGLAGLLVLAGGALAAAGRRA